MNTIHLTDDELRTAHQALTAFLHDFGHDEADTIKHIRSVIARLDAAQSEPETAEALPVEVS